MLVRFAVLCLLAVLHLADAPDARAEERLALVIGNADYSNIKKLKNPLNDARLISETLENVGFEVILETNVGKLEMERAILKFGRRLKQLGDDAVGLFFFAGHGVQSSGDNYLLPNEIDIQDDSELQIAAVRADWVLGQMESAGNRTNLVFLDSCRDNPFVGDSAFRNLRETGLAEMKAPIGTYIGYATAPGKKTRDGTGKHSPFTLALSKAIKRPGITIEAAFKRTRIEVMDRTSDKQVPWNASSLIGEFYFVEPNNERDESEGLDKLDLAFWNSVKDSNDPAKYDLYIEAFPEGAFVTRARESKLEIARRPDLQSDAARYRGEDRPSAPRLYVLSFGDLDSVGSQEKLGSEGGFADRLASYVSNNLSRLSAIELARPPTLPKSGAFNVRPSFADWRLRNVDYLMNISVEPTGDGRIKVSHRLWDVVNERQIQGLRYSTQADNWQRVGNILSDNAVEKVLGDGAYFDSRLIFVARSSGGANPWRLAIMDLNGENHKFLSSVKNPADRPVHSPFSSEVIYSGESLGKDGVFLFNLSTGRRSQINPAGYTVNEYRFLSKDQAALLVEEEDTGHSAVLIYHLRDGTTKTLFTDTSNKVTGIAAHDGHIVVALAREQDFLLNFWPADENRPRTVHKSVSERLYGLKYSPVSDQIAFIRYSNRLWRISITGLDTNEVRDVHSVYGSIGDEPFSSLSWGPNGKMLVYSRHFSGDRYALEAVSTDGGRVISIPTPTEARSPSWSNNSTQ